MTGIDLFEVQRRAEDFISIMKDLPVNSSLGERTGGYLTMVGIDGLPLDRVIVPVGETQPEKRHGYSNNSLEKAGRLGSHFNRDPSAVSSWQTRNEVEGMYGGAVIVTPRGGIISFSGLPEHYDEALCVGVGYKLGLENSVRTHRIIEVSDNTVLRELRNRQFK